MKIDNKEFPDEQWNKAAFAVIEQIRREKGIPNWLPRLLNGRHEFEKRVVLAILEKGNA
jgi:hypothetical protein